MKILINIISNFIVSSAADNFKLGAIEKNNIIDNILFIKDLYFSGYITGLQCIKLLTKNY